ncbi:hypothetical protein UNDKW_4271 [Undibacterium sp. KW1]|uniref:hypothetical protein n=1 Tax=Undibacterium sp. KW1 TaxID=2058624 RepID=UPI001331C86B|nr:hypothetical protein [Undibacterium sp. KW1]BBB62544.1 hypothetical protein UNDKW_4271 [Undibacterium sp. KW1]
MNPTLKKIAGILVLIFLAVLPLLVFIFFLGHESGEEVREIYSFEDQKTRGGQLVTISKDGTHNLRYSSETERYVLNVSFSRREISLDISLFNHDEDIISYLRKCKVIETNEGLTFLQPSGYSTFIPRSELP